MVSVPKIVGISVFALIALLMVANPAGAQPSAGSYDVNVTCGSFANDQAAAQAYFDANEQPANLDQNGDGQACADPSDGDFTAGPTAGSYDINTTCASFNGDMNAAQAYFDANDSPVNLDQNADGIACNDDASVAAAADVLALPQTGTGQPRHGTGLILLLGLVVGLAGTATLAKRSRA
jgi:hypothetical protein